MFNTRSFREAEVRDGVERRHEEVIGFRAIALFFEFCLSFDI